MDEQVGSPQQAPIEQTRKLCQKCGSAITNDMPFCPRCGNAVNESSKVSETEKTIAAKIRGSAAVNKLKSANKQQKIALASIVVAVIVVAAFAITSPPYIGKWYSVDSSEPVFEIKRNGTAVLTDNPGASASWKEMENGDIEMNLVDLSYGSAYRTSVTLEYGKTNNGVKYLDDGEDLYFKSYDDAKKIREASKTSSGSINDASKS